MANPTPAHTHPVQIRWGDIDQMGHLNNVVFADLLQQARAHWWLATPRAADLLGPTEGPDGPIGTVVAELQVEWLRPVLLGQRVEVRLGTTQVGAARFTIWYEMVADDVLVCRGRTLMAVVALRTGRVLRIPADARDYLRSVAAEVDPLRAVEHREVATARTHRYAAESRWSDTDAYGHINNAQYLELFQEARIAMIGDTPGLAGLPHVIVRCDIRYRQQAPFRLAPYPVRTGVSRIGTSSYDTHVVMLADPDDPTSVIADGWTAMVHVDDTGRPAPLPEAAVAALRRYSAPE